MKTISKYILALVALVALAPSAFALDVTSIVTDKSVKDNGNGNYTLTLETFATGAQVPVQLNTSTPTAFALILDKSSSMNEEMLFTEFTEGSISDWNNKVLPLLNAYHGGERGTYYFYAKHLGTRHMWEMFYENGKWYAVVLGYVKSSATLIDESFLKEKAVHKIFIKKIDAEKIAAKSFVDMIWNDELSKGVIHHVALITFSNGSRIRLQGETDNGMKPLIIDPSGKYNHYKDLIDEIDDLVPNGTETETDYGMANAVRALHSCLLMNRVAVLMTDGCPTTSGDFEWQRANAAIHAASILKTHLKTKVYTVGVWDYRDVDATTTTFMDWMSSNYPYAVAPQKDAYDDAVWENGAYLKQYFPKSQMVFPGPKLYNDYYNNSFTSVGEITSFFEHIAKTEIVGGSALNLNTSAEVRDYIASDFKLPAGIKAEDIVIKKVPCTGVTPYTWGTPTVITQSSDGIHAVVDATNNVVTVTGFDYTADENWVGTHYSKTDGTSYVGGYKLVFEVPIQINDTYTGGICRPTNDGGKTGFYYHSIKLKGYPVPTVDLPVVVKIDSKGLELGDNAIYNIRFTGVRDGVDSSLRFQGPYASSVMATGKGATETVSNSVLLYPGKYEVTSATDWTKKYILTVNADGSYQITNDTTITYVYQQKTNPDPCPETVAKNVFSRKTTKVSYKVKGE